jgi:DNA-binding MarR family transcriptional regulator
MREGIHYNTRTIVSQEVGAMATTTKPPLFLEAWVAFLTAHARVVPTVSQDLEAACEIPLAWFDVLHQLTLAPQGQLRMHQLADALLLSKSGLTRLVDRIEEAKLASRAAIPGDRRSMHVRITPAGRELVETARRVVQRSVAQHFGQYLSEEQQTVIRDALTQVAHGASERAERK